MDQASRSSETVKSYILISFVETPAPRMVETVLGSIEYILRNDKRILAFWNYIPLVYCFKAIEDSTFWTERFKQAIPTGQFMIAQLDPSNMNGQLPEAAWSWFYAPVEASRLQALPGLLTPG